MRLLLATLISLTVSFAIFIVVKMWGQSQPYIDYKHPFLESSQTPILFHVPAEGWSTQQLDQSSEKNFYLTFAITQDEIPVILRKSIAQPRTKTFNEIQNDVYTAEQLKPVLQNKKIIFNILENPIGGPELFIEFINKTGLQDSRNFMVLSAFEVPIKYVKEKQPTYLFGTTQPEILRIKALQSIWLLEAATYRADVVVHPPRHYTEEFFDDQLVADIKRRFKKIIIGPVAQNEVESTLALAQAKNAFGIIVTDPSP